MNNRNATMRAHPSRMSPTTSARSCDWVRGSEESIDLHTHSAAEVHRPKECSGPVRGVRAPSTLASGDSVRGREGEIVDGGAGDSVFVIAGGTVEGLNLLGERLGHFERFGKSAQVVRGNEGGFGGVETGALFLEMRLISAQVLERKARHDVVSGRHKTRDNKHGGDEASSHGVGAGAKSGGIRDADHAAIVNFFNEEVNIFVSERPQARRFRPRPNRGWSFCELSNPDETIYKSA